MLGTIKKLVVERGFGFIKAEDGQEYFFHRSGCTTTALEAMEEGDAVAFEVAQSEKGPRADSVRPA